MSDKILTGVLIDPENLTVTDVTVRANNIQDIYKLIRCPCFDVATISYSQLGETKYLSIFVDDEGLFRNERTYFGVVSDPKRKMNPGKTQLAGCGLALGPPDEQGNTLSCPMVAADLINHVVFLLDTAGGECKPVMAKAVPELKRALKTFGVLVTPWRDSEDRAEGGFRIVEVRDGH